MMVGLWDSCVERECAAEQILPGVQERETGPLCSVKDRVALSTWAAAEGLAEKPLSSPAMHSSRRSLK